MRIFVVPSMVVLLAAACSPNDEPAACSNDNGCPIGCDCVLDETAEAMGVCRTEGGSDCPSITCLGPGDCPDGMYCPSDTLDLVTDCRRACTDKTPGDGSEGASCQVDADCSSNNCDNEFEASACACQGSTGGTGGTGGAGGTGGSGGGPCVVPLSCTPGDEGDLGCGTFCMESVCDGPENTQSYQCIESEDPYCYCLCASPDDHICYPST